MDDGTTLRGYRLNTDGQAWWCNAHRRPATHLDWEGRHCCNPDLDGFMTPCEAVPGGPEGLAGEGAGGKMLEFPAPKVLAGPIGEGVKIELPAPVLAEPFFPLTIAQAAIESAVRAIPHAEDCEQWAAKLQRSGEKRRVSCPTCGSYVELPCGEDYDAEWARRAGIGVALGAVTTAAAAADPK